MYIVLLLGMNSKLVDQPNPQIISRIAPEQAWKIISLMVQLSPDGNGPLNVSMMNMGAVHLNFSFTDEINLNIVL